jgi:putative membrane protein
MARYVFVAVLVATFLTTAPVEAAQKLDANELAFLRKAAQGQLAEIALGTLAFKKASHKDVKEFGAEISEDHQYASQEVKELSATEGIYLPVQLDGEHKKQQQRLSHLSGKEFDEAFIAYVLKNHRKDLKEFEKNAATLRNEKVKQWTEYILPILTVHLKKAERVAEALGLSQVE